MRSASRRCRDAERLRAAGLSQPIVLLSGFDEPDDLPQLRRLDVETVVHHASQLAMLEAGAGGEPIRVLAQGRHRHASARLRARSACATRMRACGDAARSPTSIVLMNHFASSDEFRRHRRRRADARRCACSPMRRRASPASARWPTPPPCSAGPTRTPTGCAPGGALYGISVVDGTTGADFGLRPAMTLGTRLIAVNRVRKGERIGYSATWTCPEDMPVGVAAIGYGDGYPRHAPVGHARCWSTGSPAPIVGRVSMDLMTIDLRGHRDAKPGDPVVLWGDGLPVETIAAAAGTIGYELVCSITRRVRFVEA